MSTSPRRSSASISRPVFELLESRQFLSISLPAADATGTITPTPVQPVLTSAVVLSGRGIYAEAGQAFTAVIGTIRGLPPVPKGYKLAAMIDWGDGTPKSQASFRHAADGAIAVIGDHTYSRRRDRRHHGRRHRRPAAVDRPARAAGRDLPRGRQGVGAERRRHAHRDGRRQLHRQRRHVPFVALVRDDDRDHRLGRRHAVARQDRRPADRRPDRRRLRGLRQSHVRTRRRATSST